MATFLGRINFALGPHGWTENWYKEISGGDAYAAALGALDSFTKRRVTACARNAGVLSISVSDIAVDRDIQIKTYNPPLLGNKAWKDANADTAVLIRKMSGAQRWAMWFCRGVPLDVENPDTGEYITLPEWESAILAMFVVAGGAQQIDSWGWRGRILPTPPKVNITNVADNGQGFVSITTAGTPFAGLLGQHLQVFISGVNGAAAVNGQQVVIPSANNAATTLRRISIFPYQGPSGKLTYNPRVVWVPTSLVFERIVERKAGRPLYLSRGKSLTHKGK